MLKRQVTFDIDKRKEPVLLSEKDTILQIITMALFLKPGQNPCNPDAGVDIKKYLFRPLDEIDSTQIRNDLVRTCGKRFSNAAIKNVAVSNELIEGRYPVLALQIDLVIDSEPAAIAMVMSNMSDKKERIHLDYEFVNHYLLS